MQASRPTAVAATLALLVLVLGLTHCAASEPATQVIVVVNSDLLEATEVDSLEVRLLDRDDLGNETDAHRTFSLDPAPTQGQYEFPLSFSVAPKNPGSDQDFRLVVTGLLSGEPVVEQQVIASFQPGRSLQLGMFLARGCLDQLCTNPDGGERTRETCFADGDTGVCAEVEFRRMLDEWAGSGSELDVAEPIVVGHGGGGDGGPDAGPRDDAGSGGARPLDAGDAHNVDSGGLVDAGRAEADAPNTDAGTANWLAGRSSKRGVGYNFCDWSTSLGERDLAPLRAGSEPHGGISWYYNWGSAPADCIADALGEPRAVEFVPMAWGLTNAGADCAAGGVCFNDGLSRDDLSARILDESRYLLGFNEPNFAHQSNLTPHTAALAWQHLEHVASAHGLALVGPATNFCDPNPAVDHPGSCVVQGEERSVDFGAYTETFPAGHRYNAFAWAELFFDECSTAGAAGRDCRIDYQAGHVYSWWGLGWYVELFKRKAGLLPTSEAHCENGVEDADEFGVDCGGNDCVACTAWARAQFAKPLWLTEFAPSTDDAPATDVAQREARACEYAGSELSLLEADPFVFRYAWFMPKTDIASLDHVDLLDAADPPALTDAGRCYLDHDH